MRALADGEAWKRLVLRSMPPPAWLERDAPHCDVVLSTRSRYLRNLQGHRFPQTANQEELQQILKEVIHATRNSRFEFPGIARFRWAFEKKQKLSENSNTKPEYKSYEYY